MLEKRTSFNLTFFFNRSKINTKGEAPVYMRITVNGKKKELSLKRSISPELWNPSSGKALGSSSSAKHINTYINSVKYQIKNYEMIFREENKIITAESLMNAFLGIEDNEATVLKIFQMHNDKFKELVNVGHNAQSTLQRYETSYRLTKQYIKKFYKQDDLPLTELNHKFISDYEFFLKTERKNSHNTARKYLKNFKKIVRIAATEGLIKQDPFANHRLKLEKVDRGYLTEEELQKLIDKDIKIERLNQVKDCFVFSCFTGLAYSDLKNLKPENLAIGFDGNIWIKVNRKKTSNQCNIPVFPPAQAIIDKYKNNPYCIKKGIVLPVLTNQKYNAYLKEIADLCGITKNLTTHLARHTFATTVTLNNNVSIESVSKMLGHSSLSMTKIYARLLDKRVSSDTQHLHDKFKIMTG